MSKRFKRIQSNRHRGMVIIYVLASMGVLLGFCSLAVDLGRVQVAKTELRRAADAASRTAVANLVNGTVTCKADAVAIAAQNTADGTAVVINPTTDIQYVNWISRGKYTIVSNIAQANGVLVTARRTKATNNAIPLYFASILGMKSCDVTATSMAVLITTTQTIFVSAHSNPWLAGEPDGTLGSQPDPGYVNSDHKWKYDIAGPNGGTDPNKVTATDYTNNEPYASPTQMSIPLVPGATINVTGVSGEAQNDPRGSEYNANGYVVGSNGTQAIYSDDAANGVSEHGIADVSVPIDSLVGLFLNNNVPDGTAAPASLDFSTQASQDYNSLSPKLKQPFFIGDGETSSGAVQGIVVPQGATRMFFGTMDGHEWSNNTGGYSATITQSYIELVQ